MSLIINHVKVIYNKSGVLLNTNTQFSHYTNSLVCLYVVFDVMGGTLFDRNGRLQQQQQLISD